MFFARSHAHLTSIRQSVERIGNVSDNVIHFGPFGLGLEAILEFVPFVGEIYSVGAGLMLVLQGMRARVPASVLMGTTVLVVLRTGVGSLDFVPVLNIVGDLAAGAFRAHKMSANMILKAMDETLYVEGRRRDPENAGAGAGGEHRRVVFLG